jgi:prevent-host-death family protein
VSGKEDDVTRQVASREATTYLLDNSQLAEVVDFVSELERRDGAVSKPQPALADADGGRLEVPSPVFDALVQVATAMAHGQGVTVMPQNALLTTQEAAELLGISRPTLVRLLRDGEIPFEQRGRHRRIMLADLLTYQESMRQERRETLDRMAREGQEAGLYKATAGPPPRDFMTASVNVYEAKTHLSQLLDRAAAGKEIVIARAGLPIARLVALNDASSQRRVPGGWRGKVSVAGDFYELPDEIETAFRGDRP